MNTKNDNIVTKTAKKISTGDRFGLWEALCPDKQSPKYWVCICRGCNVPKLVLKRNLITKKTKSCGCNKVEQMKKTNLEKYGVEFVQQDSVIKGKSVETMLDRYQVENYSQSEQFTEKYKQTSIENWGEAHYRKSEKWRRLNKAPYGSSILGISKF